MLVPDFSKSRGALGTEKYIKNNYPEFYQYLLDNFPFDISFSEKIYWYRHDINKYPVCNYCGKRVNYAGPKRGYYQYCSLKCSNSDNNVLAKKRDTIIKNCGSVEESYKDRMEKTKQTLIKKYGSVEESYKDRMEKTKQTNLERYGTECILGTEMFNEKSKQTLIKKYGSVEESYKDRMEKTKQTNLERYGAEYILGTEMFNEKSKQTNLKKYGTENVMSCTHVKEKIKRTNLERYGVEYIFQSDSYKNKIKQTNLKRYNVEYPQQNPAISQKSNQTKKLKVLTTHVDIFNIEYGKDTIYTCKCPYQECDKCKEKLYKCSPQTYHNRRYNNSILCTHLLPEQACHSEGTSLEIFIRNILDEHNITYQTNCRDVIKPMELDIYIPSKNIGIECNGTYWHSDKNKPNRYHQIKYNRCSNNNIQLLTFWEDQIVHNPDIIKSILLSKLGIFEQRIYARKCTIKTIDSKICYEFLKQNHLQGNINSSIKLGLYYYDELVSIMTFGKDRISVNAKNNPNQFELYRFCNKLGVQVIGGASKLLKYFIANYSPTKITSFASNDISNGSLYNILGFEQVSESLSYWYVNQKSMQRYHRYKFRKSELVKNGYDDNKSEKQIMDELGYLRIYDCGQTKYELKIKET